MPFAAEVITLTSEERLELEQMTQSRTLPAGDVFRARLILMLAEGLPYRTVQEKLATTAPTISRWKARFLQQRVGGLLEIRHPGQKPSVITPALQAKVLAATRRKPKDGSTHWSCRKLASQLGVSKDTVQRIWHKAGLKPHRLERYMASDDPEFERKAADIIGLYLNPPQHAAVFCVDEKSAIQALDRATASNIIGMARYLSTPRWMCAAGRSTARRQPATPATSLWISCSKWLGCVRSSKTSI
jgi:transposase